jgi:hypothetical protein
LNQTGKLFRALRARSSNRLMTVVLSAPRRSDSSTVSVSPLPAR